MEPGLLVREFLNAKILLWVLFWFHASIKLNISIEISMKILKIFICGVAVLAI